jgi:pyruvate dehydrogenase E2 component (dihydrolipoamide acetyltransferase)
VKAVLMPALGVAMVEGILVRWMKSSGDSVAKGEPIMEIETDKTTIEIESPATGVVGSLLFEPGALIPVGVTMAHVLEADDVADAPAEHPDSAKLAAPIQTPPAPERVERQAPAEGQTEAAPGTGGTAAPGSTRAPNLLSPRERRLAREREQAAAESRREEPASAGLPAVAVDPASGPAPTVGGAGATGRHRELIAAKVSESWRTIPHFAVTRETDAAAMIAVRGRWGDGSGRPSFTDLMLRALALALRDRGEPGAVDVGLAVATPNGVAIPVIRGVLALDPGALRREREAAVGRAREGRLLPADLTGPPRCTLSNLGPQGIDSFTGVVAVGQTSLLSVGRIMARPSVTDGRLAVRDSFVATLNVDHRVLDGDDAAGLLMAFVAAVEDAERLERETVLA